MTGPILDSLSTTGAVPESWNKQFRPLLENLGTVFSQVWVDTADRSNHVSLVLEGGRLIERRESLTKPSWIKADTSGLFEDQSRIFFAAFVEREKSERKGWVLLRAPLDNSVLKRVSANNQVSISILTLRPVESGSHVGSTRFRFGDQEYVQQGISQVNPEAAAQFTQRQGWYDFPTRFPFFLPGVRAWLTGRPQGNIQSLYLMNSTWVRLAKRLFASGFGDESNVIVYALAGISILFLIIEFVALLSSLLMTRTITGAVHNLDEGAQHILRGDFSHRIRVKSRDQLSSLGETFNSMTASIERLLKEQAEKQRLESELAIALEVQKQLFPKESPHLSHLQITGVCNPARIVSGDYYDYLSIEPLIVGLALGDVSGKGVSAALVMASLQAALRSHSNVLGERVLASAAGGNGKTTTTPMISSRVAEIVSLLNQQLFQNTPTEKYVTFFYGVYDELHRRLTYTNAGHLPPLLFNNGGVRKLEAGGTVLGLIREAEYEQGEIHIAPKDVLVAYTDGITEAENLYDEQFGEDRLIQVIKRNLDKPASDILNEILAAVNDWVESGEPQDDMTLIVAKAL